MPPKRQIGGTGVGRPAQPKGYMSNALNELTKQENRSVVTSVAFFAAAVAFLHSNWSDVLLPAQFLDATQGIFAPSIQSKK